MTLNQQDRLFVTRRERLTRHWRWVGPLLLLALLATAVGIWMWQPHLIDPWSLMAAVEADRIPRSTLHLLALLLPLAVLVLVLVVAACLLLASAAFSNERRLIAIIRRLSH